MKKLALSLSVAVGLAAASTAQCIAASGTLVGNTADSIYPSQPIGFAFPFQGATYTDIHCSDHGICWLSNVGVPAPPVAAPLVYNVQLADFIANGPVIAPFWGDHTPGTAGAVWIENTSGTECVVKWVDVQTYLNLLPPFSFQMTLRISGEIEVAYGAEVDNYGSTFAPNAIVGATPGAPATLPAPTDLSVPGASADPTIYQEFSTPRTFDLAGRTLQLIPASPGWANIAANGPCAGAAAYGQGCVSSFNSFYQLFPDAAAAAPALTGQSITLTPAGNGYVAVWGGASYVAPTAGVPVATGDDGAVAYTPSTPLPTPFGPQATLQISGNAIIGFGAAAPVFPVGLPWVPSAVDFLVNGGLFAWHDYNVNEGGQILAEEVSSVLYVTFANVESYPGGVVNPSTLQFQLDLNTGELAIVWQSVDSNTSSLDGSGHLVGLTAPGNSLDPGSIVLATALPLITGPDQAGLALGGNAPVLGANWNLTTSNVDPVSPFTVTFFGDARVDPGLPLSVIGFPAPGCSVYINQILGNLVGLGAGSTTVTFPIPNTPSLTGAVLTTQSICLTTQTPAGLLTSNGFEGHLGR